jgi:hypothetical protein
MPSTRVQLAGRWRRLPRPVRIGVIVLAAPMFYLLPYALRSAGVGELTALVLGVLLAVGVFVGAALIAFRTVPDPLDPEELDRADPEAGGPTR